MTTEIPDDEFFAIDWDAAGVTFPYGFRPGSFPPTYNKHGHVVAPGGIRNVGQTEAVWDAYQWNPPEFLTGSYPDPDPAASPKPPWATVLRAAQVGRISRTAEFAENIFLHDAPVHRSQLTDHDTLEVGGATVRVNDNLDHMTGLLQMVEHASTAGAVMPHTVLLDGARRPKPAWTEAARREVLSAAAYRENHVESAHAEVRRKYQAEADIRDDETKTLDEREAAATKALAIAEDYPAQLAAAMAAYDPLTLPAELPDLKEAYGERIEAAAMRRVKEIKGAKTQQGVDVPATCLDMARALEEVSQECAHGIAAVDEAADNAAAKTAYDTAVAAIEAVTPLNVPEWQTDDTTAPGQGHEVHVRADHPQGANISGLVRIRSYVARDANGDPVVLEGARVTRPSGSPKSHVLSGRVPAGAAYPLTLTVEARNLCGPSTLTTTVDDPSA